MDFERCSRCVACLRVRLTGFGKGCGPRGVLPRNDCWGRMRGKVMIPANSAEGFPGLSLGNESGRRVTGRADQEWLFQAEGGVQSFLEAVFNSGFCQVDRSPPTPCVLCSRFSSL